MRDESRKAVIRLTGETLDLTEKERKSWCKRDRTTSMSV